MSKRLFVGGLPWATGDAELRQAFEGFGDVTDAKVILDRETGRSRGFGFVTFAVDAAAQEAVRSMDGASIGGRNVTVREAEDRAGGRGPGGPPRGPGGPGGDRRAPVVERRGGFRPGPGEDRGFRGGPGGPGGPPRGPMGAPPVPPAGADPFEAEHRAEWGDERRRRAPEKKKKERRGGPEDEPGARKAGGRKQRGGGNRRQWDPDED